MTASWFDEPDELNRVEEAFQSDDFDDPVAAAAALSLRVPELKHVTSASYGCDMPRIREF